MKNTEGVPYGRGLEVPESSVLSVVLILLAIANIVTNNKKYISGVDKTVSYA
ncbi:MAG: hypothetical protein J6J37_01565 [Bacteroidaceae bacterium]|nr:hypothetical protein [Bacteroidaceae bacterium]